MTEEIKAITESLNVPIVLIGMMGAGKSHVGRMLAERLSLPFHDTDKIIEKKAGCSVSEIFAQFGEEKFRESEQKTILELLRQEPSVIATGGGAVTSEETLRAIRANAVSVWLYADIETILSRLKKDESRPLLQNEDPQQVLEDLMSVRAPLYGQADIKVETMGYMIPETLEKLIKALYEHVKIGSV